MNYVGKVVRVKENGNAVVQLPKQLCANLDIRSGDSFYYIQSEVDGSIEMIRCVSFTRLKREWKKYMRRMENFDVCFQIIRAGNTVGELKSADLNSKFDNTQLHSDIYG